MIEIEDAYRYMISGYFGVMEMDSYPLKEFVLQDLCYKISKNILLNL